MLLFENLKDSASVSGIIHWLEFSAGMLTVYMSSGVAWVLMSDVTMTLLFPLIDVRVVFLNPGLSSSPLFILIYLLVVKIVKLAMSLRT